MKTLSRFATAGVVVAIFTVAATWPQALHPADRLVVHQDVYFSIWRLSWIAHALATDPLNLFNANIFYPATHTLAYSDATLLQGLLAAPLLWAGVSPALVYNLLLALGYAASGLAMFVLVRHLTGATGPALVSAAIFTITPYRLEHVMHLELQWTMWMPLTLWAAHLTAERGSTKAGVMTGVFLALQILSCVYYGVFLGMLLAIVAPLMLLASERRSWRALAAFAAGACVAAVLVLPYAWQYSEVSAALGGRDVREVVRYSARPINYLSSSGLSVLWGWTADRFGGAETRLFPGAAVLVLAFAGLFHRSKRWIAIYVVAIVVSVGISLGVNNPLYESVFERVSLLQGLRASARAAVLAHVALAVLAGYGVAVLAERKGGRWRTAIVPCLLALVLVDGLSRPLELHGTELLDPSPVYRSVRTNPGVVLELPVPTIDHLPGNEHIYLLQSLQHWQPLVNGYSGYITPSYVRMLEKMTRIGDDDTIDWLRANDVRYVIVHQGLMKADEYESLKARLESRPELHPWGRYEDWFGGVDLYRVDSR